MAESVASNLKLHLLRFSYALIAIFLISSSVLAANELSISELSTSLYPTINEPSDKSVKCIQPEDEMRRNHMNYIMHQRDTTVHNGIRKEPGSLAACIDCHVEPDANGEIAGFDSNQHFCSACHQHAAVQMDCFQCHADRPQKYITRVGQQSAASIEQRSVEQQSIKQQLQQTLNKPTLSKHDKSSEGVTQ